MGNVKAKVDPSFKRLRTDNSPPINSLNRRQPQLIPQLQTQPQPQPMSYQHHPQPSHLIHPPIMLKPAPPPMMNHAIIALPPASPLHRPPSSIQGCHILLVEDTPLNQKVASRMLEKLGCSVTIANNGQEALDKVKANISLYDLIFMDINMPVMDGYDATRLIREYEVELNNHSHVPIVAMTADCMPEVEVRCSTCGMDDITWKPIAPKKVEGIIKKWTKNNK